MKKYPISNKLDLYVYPEGNMQIIFKMYGQACEGLALSKDEVLKLYELLDNYMHP